MIHPMPMRKAEVSEKLDRMRRWLLEDRSLPIQRVRRTNTVVVIDDAAAAQLPTAS